MATTKKSPTKKKTVATATKTKTRTTAAAKAKSTAKKPTKRVRTRIALDKADRPFMTVRVTRQTIYWGIISAAVLALGVWVIDINDKVMRIYDQIDQSTLETEESMMTDLKKRPN